MIIKLEVESSVPLYEQITQQIIKGLAIGTLKPGDQLPSVRSLAADAGINYLTVNKAYQILKEKGYILIHRQKGALIKETGLPEADHEFLEELKVHLAPLLTEGLARGLSEEQFIHILRSILKDLERED